MKWKMRVTSKTGTLHETGKPTCLRKEGVDSDDNQGWMSQHLLILVVRCLWETEREDFTVVMGKRWSRRSVPREVGVEHGPADGVIFPPVY
jgi:hypothetical protein